MVERGREALRQMWRRPAFGGTVAGIMALCIGSCTALFSIISAVLFPEWPYANPERLAIIWHARGTAAGVVGLSPGDHAAYRDATRSFDALAAFTTRGYNLGGAEGPARVTCGRATPDLFPMLGVPAGRGRWFNQDDDRSGRRVVVVSDQLWRTHLGAGEDLVGRDVMVNAVPHTVIGIMPPAFVFPPAGIQGAGEADCWLPASFSPAEMATPGFDFIVLGKLKEGVTQEQAASEVAAVTHRIWESYPAAVQAQVQLRSRLVLLTEQVVAASRTPLLLFTGSVVLLLLIGCANVSNLMLTRLHARRWEMAVRTALGATRGTLVRQLLAESIALAVVGGLGGALLAGGLVAAISALGAEAFPRLEEARVELSSLAFALGCAVLAGLLGGVAPALRSRATASAGIPLGERTVAASLRRDKLRSALVVLETAMAVVILTAAGLLARSVIDLNRVDVGFNPNRVLTFSVALPSGAYPRAESVERFSRVVLEQLRQVPTVVAQASGSGLPIGRTDVAVLSIPGAAAGAPPYRPAAVHTVTPGYDTALGMTIVEGRAFTDADTMAGPAVAVVSATMARTFWSGGNVIGKTVVRLGDPRSLTVVGVMADVRQSGPDRQSPPTLYVPLAQAAEPVPVLAFAVRTSGDAGALVPHVRRALAAADASLPVFAIRTGEDLVSAATAPRRFNMFVTLVFAVLAVCLAATGLYAVMSHMVEQSSREFGVRMAMGATATGIVALVAGRALALLVPGILAGVAVAAGLSRYVASLLFGVSPDDAATVGVVSLLLLGVAALAVMIPAVRAARLDPLASLRQ